jgi:hypothetical protein
LDCRTVGLAVPAWAQTQSHNSVSVAFVVDGKPEGCTPFSVELRFDGEIIKPNHANTLMCRTCSRNHPLSGEMNQHVDISLSCSGQIFGFAKQHGVHT